MIIVLEQRQSVCLWYGQADMSLRLIWILLGNNNVLHLFIRLIMYHTKENGWIALQKTCELNRPIINFVLHHVWNISCNKIHSHTDILRTETFCRTVHRYKSIHSLACRYQFFARPLLAWHMTTWKAPCSRYTTILIDLPLHFSMRQLQNKKL